MTTSSLIEQCRTEYADERRKIEDSAKAEALADERREKQEIQSFLISPFLRAAKAAGVPHDLSLAPTLKDPGFATAGSIWIETVGRYAAGGTYTDRKWRRLVIRLPHCADIEIQPEGGDINPYGHASRQIREPDRWTMHVQIPTGISESYDWDDETEGIYFVKYEDSEPIDLADWRRAIGMAAFWGDDCFRLESMAEKHSEEARQQYRIERDPKRKPLSFFDIATDDARPDKDRQIAAVLHLAERIDAIADRIGDGIATYPAEY